MKSIKETKKKVSKKKRPTVMQSNYEVNTKRIITVAIKTITLRY